MECRSTNNGINIALFLYVSTIIFFLIATHVYRRATFKCYRQDNGSLACNEVTDFLSQKSCHRISGTVILANESSVLLQPFGRVTAQYFPVFANPV